MVERLHDVPKVSWRKWITYNAQNEPVVNGHLKMVGGTSGPSIQPKLPNYILVVVPADAVAAVKHSAERQNDTRLVGR